MTDAATEIYFDGVKISGISDGSELVFDLANEKTFIPDGAGTFTICGQTFTSTGKSTYVVRGNSEGEIKVAPLADEFKDDASEAAGKIYQYDAAGDYTVNSVTINALGGRAPRRLIVTTPA